MDGTNKSQIDPIAYPIERAPDIAGVSRTRIFQAVREKEITARKAGKSTIIEAEELRRWVRALPAKGREPEPGAANQPSLRALPGK